MWRILFISMLVSRKVGGAAPAPAGSQGGFRPVISRTVWGICPYAGTDFSIRRLTVLASWNRPVRSPGRGPRAGPSARIMKEERRVHHV